MRFLAALLSAILIILLITPVVSAQYEISPGLYNFEQSQKSGSDASQSSEQFRNDLWNFFFVVWILTASALFIILYSANRKRKQMVLASAKEKKEEDKESEILSEQQRKWARILLIGLSIETSIILFFLEQSLMFIGICGGVVAFMYNAFPKAFHEILKSSKKKPKPEQIIGEKTTFKDVGGLEEVIEELRDVVSLYKNQEEARWWDIRLPKGILLVGPPGCGKTLLARAIAGETGLPFFSYSGANIGTSYVRSGATQLKQIFQEAQPKAPCIIFLDEIDALGRTRGFDNSGEFDHALTELLHEMDGIQHKSGILVLAATNREDVLDEALLRPGRFDKKILISHPDTDSRKRILEVHTGKKHLANDINLEDIARRTSGFNGATLEQLTNEAAQLARRRCEEEKKKRNSFGQAMESIKGLFKESERVISQSDFDEAILRVLMGPARKVIMKEKEKRIVAQHEIGHAVVTAEKKLEILDKVMLMPRNWALGLTVSYTEEQCLPSKTMILGRIASLLGGRAAEEIFLGKENVTTGAGNDFEKAEELARKMVCEWGMGKCGPAIFYKLDARMMGRRYFSEHTASGIDKEVRTIISDCLEEAKRIISNKKEAAAYLVELLIEKTVLTSKDIADILKAR